MLKSSISHWPPGSSTLPLKTDKTRENYHFWVEKLKLTRPQRNHGYW